MSSSTPTKCYIFYQLNETRSPANKETDESYSFSYLARRATESDMISVLRVCWHLLYSCYSNTHPGMKKSEGEKKRGGDSNKKTDQY